MKMNDCFSSIISVTLFWNLSVDPIECKTINSVVKFFADLFGDQATTSDALLFDSDRRLIVEIISRELSDRAINDEVKVDSKQFLIISLFLYRSFSRQQLVIFHY